MLAGRALPAAMIAACSLAIAGCGTAATTTLSGAASAAGGHALSARLTEFHLQPARVVAPAGALRIIVRNDGALVQRLAISHQGVLLAQTPTIEPGQSATLSLARLAPGSYRLFCPLNNYDVLGEYGVLIVR